MRLLASIILTVSFATSCQGLPDAWTSSGDGPTSATTVLVELFTSEGCSSCPPADDVLSDLIQRQPIENVTVIGLGEHVDYWDRLGWRDPFSSSIFTSRQSEYEARVFRSGSIYTPQVVVDGRFQAVGSDRAAVDGAIADAARLQKVAVTLRTASNSATAVRVDITVDVPSASPANDALDVMVGIVQHGLVTNVQRGENSGRRLRHSAVARALTTVGTINPADRTFSRTVSVPLEATWKKSDLQAVAFVQERATRHIVGAATASMNDGHEGARAQ